MKISCCMIVKNEEKVLGASLRTAVEYVDEIIIVDTGSTDKTLEIARQYTDKIYEIKWNKNFAEARNFSVEKASFDMVLILDADERIISFPREEKESVFENNEFVTRVIIQNEMDSGLTTSSRVKRIFNRKIYHYSGQIHEQVVPMKGKMESIRDSGIQIRHKGYLKEYYGGKDKLNRNISLLKGVLTENPLDSYYLYQLGKTYDLGGERNKAIDAYESSLESVSGGNDIFAEDLLISLGYDLIHLMRYQDAKIIGIEHPEFENSADFVFFKAYALMNAGDFEAAISEFLRCTLMKEGSVSGVNSFLSYHNLGVIFECLGNLEKAIQYYEQSREYEPSLKRLMGLKGNGR